MRACARECGSDLSLNVERWTEMLRDVGFGSSICPIFYRGSDDATRLTRRHAAARRFPPPWTIDEANDVCFIVRDANGQALGYFYSRMKLGDVLPRNLLIHRAIVVGAIRRQAPDRDLGRKRPRR